MEKRNVGTKLHKLCGRRARTPTSDEAQRHRLESLDMGGPEHHVIITVIMVRSGGLKILPNIVSYFDKKYIMEESRIYLRVEFVDNDGCTHEQR